MKMQNILGALLLVIASQAAYAVDIRVYRSMDFFPLKPMKVTLVYKNNTQSFDGLEMERPKNFIDTQTTTDNPLKAVFFSNEKESWIVFAPPFITNTANNTVSQIIVISSATKSVSFKSFDIISHKLVTIGEGSVQAQEYREDV